jgi:very-short-patch-repair endonuclease
MCREAKLVIELDGGQHDARAAYDKDRTRYIESEGFRLIRFWNHDVLGNTEGVLQRLQESLGRPPPPAPPASGRGA